MLDRTIFEATDGHTGRATFFFDSSLIYLFGIEFIFRSFTVLTKTADGISVRDSVVQAILLLSS